MFDLDKILVLEMDAEDRDEVEYDAMDTSLDDIIDDVDEEEASVGMEELDREIDEEEAMEDSLGLPEVNDPNDMCPVCGQPGNACTCEEPDDEEEEY